MRIRFFILQKKGFFKKYYIINLYWSLYISLLFQFNVVVTAESEFFELHASLGEINERLKGFDIGKLMIPGINKVEATIENFNRILIEMSMFLRCYIEENTILDELYLNFLNTTLNSKEYDIQEIAKSCKSQKKTKNLKRANYLQNEDFIRKINELYQSIFDKVCVFIFYHIYQPILIENFNYEYINRSENIHPSILGTYITSQKIIKSELGMMYYLNEFKIHLVSINQIGHPVYYQVDNQIETIKCLGNPFKTTILPSLNKKYSMKQLLGNIKTDTELKSLAKKQSKKEYEALPSTSKQTFHVEKTIHMTDVKLLEYYSNFSIVTYDSFGNCGLFALCISILSFKGDKEKLIARIIAANDIDNNFALCKFILLSIMVNKVNITQLGWRTIFILVIFLDVV
ncbi:hypothetical protein NUSPORA_02468 [Nucleospora cyclopteri]